MLAILLALLASGTVAAQEWRYRVRPGDTVWDLSRKHLRPDIPWQRLQAHNAIDDPWRMPPGIQVRIPVAWLRVQPATATIVALHGEASVADAGGRQDPARTGMQVGAGSIVRTADDANLTLRFADGSRLQLHADSELRLDKLSAYGSTGMVDTRTRLLRGRSTNSAARARGPASHFIVDTPGTMASVRGTGFRIGYDTQARTTRSEVLEGRVAVSGGGRSLLLGAGLGTLNDDRNRPRPAAPLLPAPDLSSWPAELQQMPAPLSWPALDGAQGYRLQLAADPEFLTLLQDRTSDTPVVELSAPGDGVFHARVRAIDARGLEGLDAVREVRVAANPPPPFAIAPIEEGATHGPRPRFRWTRSEGAARYRLQVAADASFATPLIDRAGLARTELRAPQELPPGDYFWRIGAIDADGKHGPYGKPVRFALRDPEPGPAIGTGDVDRDRRSLQVRWPAGGDDQRYHFQLSRDRDFARIELERELDENRIELPGLGSGTWYMRTRLVDSDGYAHPFGPVQSVRIGCLPCRIALGVGAALLLVL
ncbi:FecR domain-containing protein [Luteimonas sp. SJ-92]|uniref:FecR domain-containing protein n=1 Tax=Luteimonas salinisoli TaxID=2752307 RepID=A0A853JFI8_9GAMM|nr:FecR domain-containing protein [Luteimonas salinisoli]